MSIKNTKEDRTMTRERAMQFALEHTKGDKHRGCPKYIVVTDDFEDFYVTTVPWRGDAYNGKLGPASTKVAIFRYGIQIY
jgi:hypothetical protein